ncbi:cytoplasmic tRNA 2-thiolation protein 1, partial [Paragonimus westermani]
PPLPCCRCDAKGYIKRPKTGDVLCRDCFSWCFEEEVHWTIKNANLLQPGDRIAIGASGGKDSTVLAYIMKLLNTRYNYGVELMLLSIDEGISGYRDESLETVRRNQKQYCLPLTILSYKVNTLVESLLPYLSRIYLDGPWIQLSELLGKSEIVSTFCGIFRRQALDKGAAMLKANKICTGHNADDVAETVLMNILRGDIGRLRRCTAIVAGSEGMIPRFKPFKYVYEKEIVMYAHLHKLDYFSTECKYAPNAYRGYARTFIKDLERFRPRSILDIINSGEQIIVKADVKVPVHGTCEKCGCVSSQRVCHACVLLEGLNAGLPQLKVGERNPEDCVHNRIV